MKSPLLFLPTIALAGLLAGCNDNTSMTNAGPVPRPVVSMLVEAPKEQPAGFAGTIQPQFQTERGFRVLGRLIARRVDVGDVVTPGQVLAQIDPLLLELAVRSSEADLAKAKAQLDNATATESRRRALLAKDVVTQADFDTAQQSLEAATAGVKQAEANLTKAREQRSYATLTADTDGVVTSVDAEVGQMVTAGKKVMTIARTDSREAVVDIPDFAAHSLSLGQPFTVGLQADPSVTVSGKIREIAPQADQATRTRRVKIALDRNVEAFRLGTTITVWPVEHATAQTFFDIPASAIVTRDGGPHVWRLDPKTKTVQAASVEIADRDSHNVRIRSGLAAGERIVVAGVNSLSNGQVVKFDQRNSP